MRKRWCSSVNVKEVTTGTCWWSGTLLSAFAEAPWPRTIRPSISLSHRFLGSKLKRSACWRKRLWKRWTVTFFGKWCSFMRLNLRHQSRTAPVFDESPSPDGSIIRNVKASWSLSPCDTMTLFLLLLLLIIFIVVIERCSRSTLSAKFVLLYRADAISPDLNPICLLTAKHGWKEG